MYDSVVYSTLEVTYVSFVQVIILNSILAPIGRPTLILENTMATSATLKWSSPIGYDTIASSGGIWYTIAVENKATRQKRTVTADDTTLSYSMAHSTQYCFTVRAEVSGGSGNYSREVCFTTPGTTECFHVTSEWCHDKLGMSLYIMLSTLDSTHRAWVLLLCQWGIQHRNERMHLQKRLLWRLLFRYVYENQWATRMYMKPLWVFLFESCIQTMLNRKYFPVPHCKNCVSQNTFIVSSTE